MNEDLKTEFECVSTKEFRPANSGTGFKPTSLLSVVESRLMAISACNTYAIAAEGWPEIIRYEDGYNSALEDLKAYIEKHE